MIQFKKEQKKFQSQIGLMAKWSRTNKQNFQ